VYSSALRSFVYDAYYRSAMDAAFKSELSSDPPDEGRRGVPPGRGTPSLLQGNLSRIFNSQTLFIPPLASYYTGCLKFNVKNETTDRPCDYKLVTWIGKGIIRRKCEMNVRSKTHRLASRRIRTVCFGTQGLAKVLLVRLKHPELGAPNHFE